MGQQDLRGRQADPPKSGLVDLRQAHLADGGRGLQRRHLARPYGPAQAQHALGDGARTHHQDFLALLAQQRELARPLADRCLVEARAVVGDQAGADLDDDAPGLLDQGPGCQFGRGGSGAEFAGGFARAHWAGSPGASRSKRTSGSGCSASRIAAR